MIMLYRIRCLVLFVILFFSAFVADAEGQANCLDESIRTVKTKEYVYGIPFFLRSKLLGEELAGYFVSRMQAAVRVHKDNAYLAFHFLRKEGLVGLPYQINKVSIKAGSRTIFEEDFTENCQKIGLSVFPGGKQYLGPLRLSKSGLQACGNSCKLKLIVWGGLH